MGQQKVFETFFRRVVPIFGSRFPNIQRQNLRALPQFCRKEDKPGSHRAAGREQFGQMSLHRAQIICAFFSYENDAASKTEIKNRAINSGGKDVYEKQKQQRCRANERPNRHVHDP